MSGKVSSTLKALHEMRQEQQRMREQLAEMHGTVMALGENMVALGERTHEQAVRLATEVHDVNATLVDVRELLRARLDLRDEVRDHERRIAALERRTG